MKSKLAFAAMCALFCGLFVSIEASAQDLPDGAGKADVINVCTACHDSSMFTELRQTKQQWTSTVYDMIQRGANPTDDQITSIIAYLTTNFGPPTAAPSTPATSAPSSAPPASTPSTSPATTPSTPPASTSRAPMALNASASALVNRVLAESVSFRSPRVDRQPAHSGSALNATVARHATNTTGTAAASPHTTRDNLARYLGSFPSVNDSAHM